MHRMTLAAFVGRCAFGMGDAAPSGHPIDVPRHDHLFRTERVLVIDRTRPEEGHRRQADMRMRPHVDTAPRFEYGRPHVIDEHERPHAAGLQAGHGAAHFEATAQVVDAGSNESRHEAS
jgi:hypothetical protein